MRMNLVVLVVVLGICGSAWGDSCTNPPGRFGLTDGEGIMVVVSRDPKDSFPGGSHDRAEWHFHWVDVSRADHLPVSGMLPEIKEKHRHFSVFPSKKARRFILFDAFSGHREDHRPRLLVYILQDHGAKLERSYTLEELVGSKEDLNKVEQSESQSHILWVNHYEADDEAVIIYTFWKTCITLNLTTWSFSREAYKKSAPERMKE